MYTQRGRYGKAPWLRQVLSDQFLARVGQKGVGSVITENLHIDVKYDVKKNMQYRPIIVWPTFK